MVTGVVISKQVTCVCDLGYYGTFCSTFVALPSDTVVVRPACVSQELPAPPRTAARWRTRARRACASTEPPARWGTTTSTAPARRATKVRPRFSYGRVYVRTKAPGRPLVLIIRLLHVNVIFVRLPSLQQNVFSLMYERKCAAVASAARRASFRCIICACTV